MIGSTLKLQPVFQNKLRLPSAKIFIEKNIATIVRNIIATPSLFLPVAIPSAFAIV